MNYALKLACDYLARKSENYWTQSQCPFTVFNVCMIPKDKHPVVCDDFRSDCWYEYFTNLAQKEEKI